MEQYYPFPDDQLREIVARHQGAELVWVQDEPENQGAWPFIALEMRRLGLDNLRVVSRPASASPATGSSSRSAEEHAAVMEGAFEGL
jgi:2-oxoglutarate dehydrogenase E1 component